MRIVQLELRGFRGVKQGQITLPRHCVLLGPNDVGKSTIAESLALLAGKDRLARPLCDWDFYGGSPDAASRFTIIATITDFGDGTSQDPAEFPDWFAGERSARPVWWHEEPGKVTTEVDPPPQTQLAAQIALTARYVEEESEFETVRWFYDGETDPFTEEYRPVPGDRLRELGVFLLPSARNWDRILAFGSSSFLKMLREYGGVPGKAIEDLKQELRKPNTRIEDAPGLKDVLDAAETELRSFLVLESPARLAYRATALDVLSVLRSLVPHVARADDELLPVARHGSGMVSLQVFVVLLAFAQYRLKQKRDFLFVAEEPELHLHPSSHRRLVSRVRSTSTQSVVTTHSPSVASHYSPSEVLYLRNKSGTLSAEVLRRDPISPSSSKSIRKLYLIQRHEFYDALMGGSIVVPEGISDRSWLALWLRVAESSDEVAQELKLRPMTFVPTHDGAITETYAEVCRFRPDVLPVVDGDSQGAKYAQDLAALSTPPQRIARYGADAAIEYLSAWILEPCLGAPGQVLGWLLPDPKQRTLRALQEALVKKKTDRALREALAWETLETTDAVKRAGEFLQDLGLIATGAAPKNTGWTVESDPSGCTLYTATHIQKATS